MMNFSFGDALGSNFFARATSEVARDLLGTVLVRQIGDIVFAGRIVETEAYLPDNDAASHAFRGETVRNRAMFGSPGTLYVYRIYGIHQCVNIVTEEIGRGAAVLLRSLEPLCGIEAMMAHRGTKSITALCNGPAKLAQALQFTVAENSVSCCQTSLFLLPSEHPCEIATSPRIGITKATALPLRFFIPKSRFVSQGKPSV